MTRELQIETLKTYQEKFKKWEAERADLTRNRPPGMGIAVKHAKWMMDEMLQRMETNTDKPGQADRWIGFIQGIFWCEGLFSIEDMKTHNTDRMKLIGLTGGIASGKSAVTSMLRDRGYHVLDLDQIARDVVQPGTPGLAKLVDEFGADLDGSLDRKKLADLVFNDKKEELAWLDNLMGPLLWSEVERRRDNLKRIAGDMAFLDAALLIEKDMHKDVDAVILVTAPVEMRVRRAMARDKTTEKQVRSRMAAQLSDDEKRTHADYVIDNAGTLENLRFQVTAVLRKLHESL